MFFTFRSFFLCNYTGKYYFSGVVATTQFTAPKTPVIEVRNSAANAKRITISFTNYNSNYRVSVYRDGSVVESNIRSGSTVDIVDDFATTYAYHVMYSLSKAAPACADSANSSVIQICTYPDKVKNVGYSVTNSTWTMVTWDPLPGVTGYKWYVQGSGTVGDVGTDTHVNITHLAPSETYFVNVISYYTCSATGETLESIPAGTLVKTMPRSVTLATLPLSPTSILLTVNTTDQVCIVEISQPPPYHHHHNHPNPNLSSAHGLSCFVDLKKTLDTDNQKQMLEMYYGSEKTFLKFSICE